MELVIKNKPLESLEEIKWNYEELKEEVAAKVETYKTTVYTADEIAFAKKDRAMLNKFADALESKRKEIKKAYLVPYAKFEAEIKDVVAIVTEASGTIGEQINAFDEERKAEKREKIESYLADTELTYAEKIQGITIPFNDKWLNASVSIANIEKEVGEIIDRIIADLDVLSHLPEYSFEAVEFYKSTLSLNKSLEKVTELRTIAKAKEEAESKLAEDVKEIKLTETEADIRRDWVSFRCLLSEEDAMELGRFFKNRNIKFEQI